MDEIIPCPGARQELTLADRVLRRSGIDARLGPVDPGFVLLQALLGLADRVEIEIEALAIGGAERIAHRAGLAAQIVQDTAAILELADLAGGFLGRALDEEISEHGSRL